VALSVAAQASTLISRKPGGVAHLDAIEAMPGRPHSGLGDGARGFGFWPVFGTLRVLSWK
jgi:hypothetical protein